MVVLNKIEKHFNDDYSLLKKTFEVYKNENEIIGIIFMYPDKRNGAVIRIPLDYKNNDIIKAKSRCYGKCDIDKLICGYQCITDKYIKRINYAFSYMFDALDGIWMAADSPFHCDITNIFSYPGMLRFLLSSYTIEEFVPEMYGENWKELVYFYKVFENGE